MKKGDKVLWKDGNIETPYFRPGIIYTVENEFYHGLYKRSKETRLNIEGVTLPNPYHILGMFSRRFRVASPEEIATLPHHN